MDIQNSTLQLSAYVNLNYEQNTFSTNEMYVRIIDRLYYR